MYTNFVVEGWFSKFTLCSYKQTKVHYVANKVALGLMVSMTPAIREGHLPIAWELNPS